MRRISNGSFMKRALDCCCGMPSCVADTVAIGCLRLTGLGKSLRLSRPLWQLTEQP